MEQKVAARVQILEDALVEMSAYLKELSSARAWLKDALRQTEDPVPQTLSVEDLGRSRKQHEVILISFSIITPLLYFFLQRINA